MTWREVRHNQFQYYDEDSGVIVGEVSANYCDYSSTFNTHNSGRFISLEHAQKDVEKAYQRMLDDRKAKAEKEEKKTF